MTARKVVVELDVPGPDDAQQYVSDSDVLHIVATALKEAFEGFMAPPQAVYFQGRMRGGLRLDERGDPYPFQ